ncbi:cysteine-rich CWC family protein [Colwellia sp. RE-S-Sl-9]
MNEKEYVSVSNCPLCNKPNNCGNLLKSNKPCWCMDEIIDFPESLLNQVVDIAKNKTCICKSCALKHKQDL